MDQNLQNCEPKQPFFVFINVIISGICSSGWKLRQWMCVVSGVSLSTMEESDGHKGILGW